MKLLTLIIKWIANLFIAKSKTVQLKFPTEIEDSKQNKSAKGFQCCNNRKRTPGRNYQFIKCGISSVKIWH